MRRITPNQWLGLGFGAVVLTLCVIALSLGSPQREQSATTPSAQTIPHLLKRHEDLRASVSAMNVPIAFWGKVVDQDGKPLAGAKVRATVRQWYVTATLNAEAKSIRQELETKVNGIFTISEPGGDVVSIDEISKDGYELSPKAVRAFNYTRGATANSNGPAVFRMWKKGEKQALQTGKGFFGIIPDGREYTIDFATRKKAPAGGVGDIAVSIARPLDAARNAKYDWSFTVKAIGGGIVKTEDEFMYLAPETGYASEMTFQFKATDPGWTHRVQTQFFLKIRGGTQFARVNAEVFAHYDNEAVFSVEYAVNTNGLRNLE